MKTGDWVRFCTEQLRSNWHKNPPDWKEGLLIEYHTWEKIARVLHEGKIVAVRAEQCQLAKRAPESIQGS